MAFPSGYTKYQVITIDNTKVSADLTDYVVYVDLADMDTTTDIFDTCRTDGGDIRVTKSDGTTELAREVVAIDTTGKTGELHIKYSGTLSSSSDTDIWIWYNGTDTEPAVTATYGRNNVWSNYVMVMHMQQDPSGSAPQMVDSTGNSHSGTSNGTMTSGDLVTGKLAGGYALDMDGSNDYISVSDAADLDNASGGWAWQWWMYKTGGTSGGVWKKGAGATNADGWGWYLNGTTSGYSRVGDTDTTDIYTDWTIVQNQWNMMHAVIDRSANFTNYLNGTSHGTPTSATAVGDLNTANDLWLGGRGYTGSTFFTGQMDEFRVTGSVLSSNWISTEYNNQNSPSTFYSVGAEQTSGGGPTVNSNFFAFM